MCILRINIRNEIEHHMSKGFLDTPIGTLEIKAESGKIIGIDAVHVEPNCAAICRTSEMYAAEQDEFEIGRVKAQLTEYFAGKRRDFDVDIEFRGTDFQKKVWQTLLAIPYGKTMSYAQVAEAAGSPGAQRAAGSAIGKNPLLIVVPCHRVIRSDGGLGGFSAGIENKLILQRIENIDMKR